MNSKEKGIHNETLVCSYLQDKGYEILKRNFQIREGEIDIIAKKESIICAVEVKTIPLDWPLDDVRYKINSYKEKRIKMTLSSYLASVSDNKYYKIRFDAAVVQGTEVFYWEGAF